MLTSLSIRNIVLIDQLDIDFQTGLSVLTGETGAGKSILLDGLSIALGARGDGGLVRAGCDQGQVTAVFQPGKTHAVWHLLEEQAIESEDELVLRRIQNADGRTKAFVNDTPISAGLLRQIGGRLVEIHGQHDDRAMLDPATHRQLLDFFGGLEPQLKATRLAWQTLSSARKQLATLEAKLEAAQKEADYLRAASAELLQLAPEPGEETALADRRQIMMKSEQLASDLNEAIDMVSGGASPIPNLAGLAKRLERKREQVPGLLDESVQYLDEALNALYAVQNALDTALNKTEFDPSELERAEERLFALRAASRKYSVPVEALPDLAVSMSDQIEALDHGEAQLAELKKTVLQAEKDYFGCANSLSEARGQAAELLVASVAQELPALKLEAAEFLVEHVANPENAGADGIDAIEFWVRTNPGTRAGPMVKVASGGELSRFMLALKVSLADKGSAPTLVFDEIDTGVGGSVADAIGQRLYRLAERVQVLSITHAPQVAARASGHFLIAKGPTGEDGTTATRVKAINETERREEIARMLAGATITDEARRAADRLLAPSG